MPFELLEIVANMLEVPDYLHLRMTSRFAACLDRAPLLDWTAYRKITKSFKVPSNGAIRLDSNYFELEQFHFLLNYSHYNEMAYLIDLHPGRIPLQERTIALYRIAGEMRHSRLLINSLLKRQSDVSPVDPSYQKELIIRTASTLGYADIVKLVLQYPESDPGELKNEALLSASSNNHIEIVGILVDDTRVDPSAQNGYILT